MASVRLDLCPLPLTATGILLPLPLAFSLENTKWSNAQPQQEINQHTTFYQISSNHSSRQVFFYEIHERNSKIRLIETDYVSIHKK